MLVQDPEKAQDLSQEFFTRLSEPGGLLQRANPDKGLFRNYLQQALRNLVIDYHRRNRKEGVQTHPDHARAEGWEVLKIAKLPEAETAFHRAWVKVTLAEALTQVQTVCRERKQEAHFELFHARYLRVPILRLLGRNWVRATAWIKRLPAIARRPSLAISALFCAACSAAKSQVRVTGG